MKRGLIGGLILSLAFISLKAQKFFCSNVYLTPAITIGYTFGGRVCYGADLDLGYCNKDKKDVQYRVGLSASYYLVEVKNHLARIATANLMFQKGFADLKTGIGRVHSVWGYQGRNKSTAYGFSYDLSIALPDRHNNSWLGIRHFVYKPGTWPFFEIPYTSAYLKYKYNLSAPEAPAITGSAR